MSVDKAVHLAISRVGHMVQIPSKFISSKCDSQGKTQTTVSWLTLKIALSIGLSTFFHFLFHPLVKHRLMFWRISISHKNSFSYMHELDISFRYLISNKYLTSLFHSFDKNLIVKLVYLFFSMPGICFSWPSALQTLLLQFQGIHLYDRGEVLKLFTKMQLSSKNTIYIIKRRFLCVLFVQVTYSNQPFVKSGIEVVVPINSTNNKICGLRWLSRDLIKL